MKHRFEVVEYASDYAVCDKITGNEAHMSDGVDCVFTPTGKAMSPGTERMRRAWEKALNQNPSETLEAYFPETYESEAD